MSCSELILPKKCRNRWGFSTPKSFTFNIGGTELQTTWLQRESRSQCVFNGRNIPSASHLTKKQLDANNWAPVVWNNLFHTKVDFKCTSYSAHVNSGSVLDTSKTGLHSRRAFSYTVENRYHLKTNSTSKVKCFSKQRAVLFSFQQYWLLS